ncbi:MAG: hypothetical protein EPN86_00335 [Nanoarchaeota archaeon]|nr:MAG: hypothetical protein EPN86_00335 [Nanoarchaeota archaeon]
MLSSRKAQGGGASTAAFIALVTLFIILWILFLPPAERDKILNNESNASAIEEHKNVLLDESPKTLFVEKQSEFIHRVNPVNLYITQEDQVIKRRDAILVESGSGKQESFQIPFHVDDPKNVGNAQLAFTVESHSGSIEILLNGNIIFSGEITDVAPSPISLDNLEQDNILEFRVSNPGWEFWKVNSYQLRDVRILATVTNVNNREASTQFSVTYTPDNVDTATLTFLPDCVQPQVGELVVTINSQVLTSKVPDCGSVDIVDFDPKILLKGTNILDFKSNSGAILIDNIQVDSKLNTPTYPIYYFELNSTNFKKVQNGDKHVQLIMTFAGDADKIGTININNRKLSFNQNSKDYSKDIAPFVIEDNNFLQIIPEKTLNVQQLTVKLQ